MLQPLVFNKSQAQNSFTVNGQLSLDQKDDLIKNFTSGGNSSTAINKNLQIFWVNDIGGARERINLIVLELFTM